MLPFTVSREQTTRRRRPYYAASRGFPMPARPQKGTVFALALSAIRVGRDLNFKKLDLRKRWGALCVSLEWGKSPKNFRDFCRKFWRSTDADRGLA